MYVPAPGLHASAQEDESHHTVKETPPEANGRTPLGRPSLDHKCLTEPLASGFQQHVAPPPALINVLKILSTVELLASLSKYLLYFHLYYKNHLFFFKENLGKYKTIQKKIMNPIYQEVLTVTITT